MLKIRLSRVGRVHKPVYRIVVAEHTMPVKGRFVEVLGTYDNSRMPKKLLLDVEKYNYWISKGAKPSDTVTSLVKKNVLPGEKKIDKEIFKKRLPKKNKDNKA